MKNLIAFTIILSLFSSPLFAQGKAGKQDTTKHESFYSCPNHSEVKSHQAGKCSKCGMELTLSNKEKMKASQSKNYTCPVHLDVVAHDPGTCPKCGKKLNLSQKEQMKAEATKLYTCTMHPDVSLDKEGNCPKCGKELIEKKKTRL